MPTAHFRCPNASRAYHGRSRRSTSSVCATSACPTRRSSICRALLLSRSEEHTSVLQSLMRILYAVFCLKTNKWLTAASVFAYITSAEHMSELQYQMRTSYDVLCVKKHH